jgi:hypothetical protein
MPRWCHVSAAAGGAFGPLKPRALITVNDLTECWRRHLGQEHQRVHGQRDHGLTA